MSDTPITDASEFKPEPSDGPSDGGYVSATLARRLERELASANARLAYAADCLKRIERLGRGALALLASECLARLGDGK